MFGDPITSSPRPTTCPIPSMSFSTDSG